MESSAPDYADTVIIGGGFYGMYLAAYFAERGKSVFLAEQGDDFMQRASLINQARVHQGYHYPRSVLTALRSRISFPRFLAEFPECVVDTFQKYYFIGRRLGKVTAHQFTRFCERIGAPCEPAPYHIQKLASPDLIEACFSTVECAFDAVKLKQHMIRRLNDARVGYKLNTAVRSVKKVHQGIDLKLVSVGPGGERTFSMAANQVFNATYSGINRILSQSALPIVPLKHEVTEMCLVSVPEELRDIGITVMCGPFFSCMPFPTAGLHSVSHVRYTPHCDWYELDKESVADGDALLLKESEYSAWGAMRADVRRYVPLLGEAKYERSIWEVKTILPISDVDDSRPILFRRDQGIEGVHCVMGGKIDNVYDVIAAIEGEGL